MLVNGKSINSRQFSKFDLIYITFLPSCCLQDFVLQNKTETGYVWDYYEINPPVLTSGFRIDILDVYGSANNGFVEVDFITNNGMLTKKIQYITWLIH